MLKYILLLVFCASVSVAFGQDAFSGTVYEFKTHIGIAGVEVRNMTSRAVTTTDEKGRFLIGAKKGDLMIFKSFSYAPDTLVVTTATQEVYLVPMSKMLKEVKVKTDSTTRFNSYYDPEFHGQPVVYQRDGDMNYKGGIAIRINDSHSSEKKHAKLEKELSDQQTQDEINKLFTPEGLTKYVPLKGQDMADFIALYTPTPDQYSAKNFSLLLYLNDCYKKFQQLPPEKRHIDKLPDDALTNPGKP
jgi:hypothetical protein